MDANGCCPLLDFGSPGLSLVASSVAAAIGVGQLNNLVLGGFHTCAIATDAKTHCWGHTAEGQVDHLVAGNFVGLKAIPLAEEVTNSSVVPTPRLVATGAYHVCVLGSGGVFCWGHNADGEVGDGTFNEDAVGTTVTGTAGALHLAAGGFHTCTVLATTPAGTVACWGNDDWGHVTGTGGPGSRRAAPFVLAVP